MVSTVTSPHDPNGCGPPGSAQRSPSLTWGALVAQLQPGPLLITLQGLGTSFGAPEGLFHCWGCLCNSSGLGVGRKPLFSIFIFLSLLSSMAISTWRSSMRSAAPRDPYSPLWNCTCLDPPKPCLFVPLSKFLRSVGPRPMYFSNPSLRGSWNPLQLAKPTTIHNSRH